MNVKFWQQNESKSGIAVPTLHCHFKKNVEIIYIGTRYRHSLCIDWKISVFIWFNKVSICKTLKPDKVIEFEMEYVEAEL